MQKPEKRKKPKSWADYKRASRARAAELARLAGDPTDKIARQKFNEYLTDEDRIEIWTYLDWAGIEADWETLLATDDDLSRDQSLDDEKGGGRGSIGHAEKTVSFLLDAASYLASRINEYKRAEIDRAIREIEAGDLARDVNRNAALDEIERLKKMRYQLAKRVRYDLPKWRVTSV